MTKTLIEIEYGTFIFKEDVKFIIFSNVNNRSFKRFKKCVIENNKLFKLNKTINSYVITSDNCIYACKSFPNNLVQRLNNLGHQMLGVSEDYYIALFYIKVLSNVDNILVSGIRKQRIETTDDLQFVHQYEKRKSMILLTTNEIIYLSKDTSELVKSISDVKQYEDIFCD